MEYKDLQLEGYPFRVLFDPNFDWEGLTFRVEFKSSPTEEDKNKLALAVNEWAEKGIKDGYGKGVMHDLDPDFEWNNGSLEFYADMGLSDEKATEELFGKLAGFGFIKEIKLGFGEN